MNKVVWCRQGWFPVPYCFCPSEAAWRRVMKSMNVMDGYPTADARTTYFTKDGKLRIIVTVGEHIDRLDPLGIVGLIVHEAAHVWQEMCEHCGDTQPSKETEAYALQLISGQLLSAYVKTRLPK